MTITESTTARYTAVLSVPVPPGCLPVETIQVVGADGAPVLSVVAVPSDDTVAALADKHRSQLVAAFAGVELEDAAVPMDRLRDPAPLVVHGRTSTDPTVGATLVCAAYAVVGSWAFVAVASTAVPPGAGEPGTAARLEQLVLDAVPPSARPSMLSILSFSGTAEKRAAPAPSAWHPAAAAWAGGPRTDVTSAPARIFTMESLAAAAALAGASSVPGVNLGPLAQLTAATRQAVLASAGRGLVAAGAAVVGLDAGLAGARLVDPALAVTFDHDLLVQLAVTEAGVTRRVAFAARPDAAVCIEPIVHDAALGGLVAVAALAVDELASAVGTAATLLGAVTGTSVGSAAVADLPLAVVAAAVRQQADDLAPSARSSAGHGHELSAAAAEMVAVLAATTRTVRLRSLYRYGAAIVGGDAWFAAGPDTVVWLESTDDRTVRARVVDADGVRGALGALLPGGGAERLAAAAPPMPEPPPYPARADADAPHVEVPS